MKKIALITGASSGMGKATAIKLLEAGYIVYGAARRVERMADLKERGVQVISMDVTNNESMGQAVRQIIQEHGKIDVLINNAGYGSYGAIEDVPLEEARRQFEVNIFGLARLTQLTLPSMRENKSGKIVNVSSMGGKIYTPMGGWYHATKHALEGFSDCLRFEVKPFGIDVIVIEPGLVKSEWSTIVTDGLTKTSGSTAYFAMTKKAAKLYKENYNHPKVSKPTVIADTILKALEAKNPKARYAAGYNAKLFLFLRKILPDKIYDAALAMALK
mgnify:CR=1 FL=1